MSIDLPLRDKRVVVMGLGRFGGGIGVTRWLCRQGARVVVTDRAPADELEESVRALDGLDVELRLGGHNEADLDRCDLLVISPAVDKPRSPFVQAAIRRGVPWTSEMNLFLQRCPARTVGITGSVGKSTTTAMLGEVLESASRAEGWRHGRVWLGGNIGKSLLDDLPEMRPSDVVVLELSSFQLEDAAAIRWSPHIALVTNVRENHLDRHGEMRSYAAAKANIFRFQRDGDALVLPDCGVEPLDEFLAGRRPAARFGVRAASRTIDVSGPSTSTSIPGVRLAVPGAHNLWNAAAALTIARVLGVATEPTLSCLAEFPGLPHRLEFVREHRGVRYYNDSKATTPEAAVTALEAFDGPVVMICGGADKGLSFDEFGRSLSRRAKAVVCVGATRNAVAAAVHAARGDAASPVVEAAADFPDAVARARRLAAPGDAVVLSPGCASYDMFRNYEFRGAAFREIVTAQPGASKTPREV